MPGKYKEIDHTADMAFEVSGKSLEDLFIASAEAWRSTVSDEKVISGKESKKIVLGSSSGELLLVEFLNELNFLLLTRKWMFNRIIKIKIIFENNEWALNCEIEGEPILSGAKIKQEIKAITFHQMEIKKIGNNFSTLLVFDI